MTAQKIDDLSAQRRKTQAHNNDLLSYVSDSTRLSHAARNEQNIALNRRGNAVARIAAENIVQSSVDAQEYDRRINGLVQDQNSKLASQISQRNAKQDRIEREVQRMCDNSEELKELEKKLNIAYVNKERAAQHQEGLLSRQLERARETAMDDQMEYERQAFLQAEGDKVEARRLLAGEQKTVLQRQIMERQVLAVEAREEAQRDKDMVEQIVQKINTQDRLEVEERNMKKEETRALVKFFQAERDQKKADILHEEKRQEAEIKTYYDLLAKRNAEEDAAKKAAEEEKKRRWAKVVAETRQQNQSKEEFNILRDMLWEEELEAKRIADDKNRVIKREADKKEMMTQNQKQLSAKKVMIQEMEDEEQRIVKVMLAKFAQDEQLEVDKQQARQGMKDSYIQNIQGQRAQRAALYESEKQREMEERDYAGEMEEYRLRVVAEARKRLLEQHAVRLKGFLPKGAIRGEDEHRIMANADQDQGYGFVGAGGRANVARAKSGYPNAQQYEALR
jgi:hypothetical protein